MRVWAGRSGVWLGKGRAGSGQEHEKGHHPETKAGDQGKEQGKVQGAREKEW